MAGQRVLGPLVGVRIPSPELEKLKNKNMTQKTRTLFLGVSMVVVFALLAGASCQKQTTTKETQKQEQTQEQKKDDTEKNWTDSADTTGIAATAIAGKINDKKIKIATAQIKKWTDGSYSWTFSNIAPDSVCGVLVGNDAVNFSSKVLKQGTFEKKMEEKIEFSDYSSYYNYKQENGTPMSVNTDWSAKIVVEKIDSGAKKASGAAIFDFSDGKTKIDGKFEADLCE